MRHVRQTAQQKRRDLLAANACALRRVFDYCYSPPDFLRDEGDIVRDGLSQDDASTGILFPVIADQRGGLVWIVYPSHYLQAAAAQVEGREVVGLIAEHRHP